MPRRPPIYPAHSQAQALSLSTILEDTDISFDSVSEYETAISCQTAFEQNEPQHGSEGGSLSPSPPCSPLTPDQQAFFSSFAGTYAAALSPSTGMVHSFIPYDKSDGRQSWQAFRLDSNCDSSVVSNPGVQTRPHYDRGSLARSRAYAISAADFYRLDKLAMAPEQGADLALRSNQGHHPEKGNTMTPTESLNTPMQTQTLQSDPVDMYSNDSLDDIDLANSTGSLGPLHVTNFSDEEQDDLLRGEDTVKGGLAVSASISIRTMHSIEDVASATIQSAVRVMQVSNQVASLKQLFPHRLSAEHRSVESVLASTADDKILQVDDLGRRVTQPAHATVSVSEKVATAAVSVTTTPVKVTERSRDQQEVSPRNDIFSPTSGRGSIGAASRLSLIQGFSHQKSSSAGSTLIKKNRHVKAYSVSLAESPPPVSSSDVFAAAKEVKSKKSRMSIATPSGWFRSLRQASATSSSVQLGSRAAPRRPARLSAVMFAPLDMSNIPEIHITLTGTRQISQDDKLAMHVDMQPPPNFQQLSVPVASKSPASGTRGRSLQRRASYLFSH